MTTGSAQERKARLEALRIAAELFATPGTDKVENVVPILESSNVANDSQPGEEQEKVIRFRNYVPRSRNDPTTKFDDPVARVPADAYKIEEPPVSFAPKKTNWDLRKDAAKKLEKLERRTQRAIIHLMREEEKHRHAASLVGDAGNGTSEVALQKL